MPSWTRMTYRTSLVCVSHTFRGGSSLFCCIHFPILPGAAVLKPFNGVNWATSKGHVWWVQSKLRWPQTVRRPKLSILKEINAEYSLGGLMLKLQYFGHLMWRTDTLEKNLMLGKIEGRRRRGAQRMRWVDSITDSMDLNSGKFREMVRDRETWCAAVHGVSKSRARLGNWTISEGIVHTEGWLCAQHYATCSLEALLQTLSNAVKKTSFVPTLLPTSLEKLGESFSLSKSLFYL